MQSLEQLEERSSSAPSSHAVVTLVLDWHKEAPKVPRKHRLHQQQPEPLTQQAAPDLSFRIFWLFFWILTPSESHSRDPDSSDQPRFLFFFFFFSKTLICRGRAKSSPVFLLRADGSATRCALLLLRPICFRVFDVRFRGLLPTFRPRGAGREGTATRWVFSNLTKEMAVLENPSWCEKTQIWPFVKKREQKTLLCYILTLSFALATCCRRVIKWSVSA